MWRRLWRALRAVFGGAVESTENAELILKQSMRDMEDQIPAMNNSIAMMGANVNLLEKELLGLNKASTDLEAKIKAALTAGRRDIATSYVNQFQTVTASKAATEGQLLAGKKAFDNAKMVKEAFMRNLEEKRKKAMSALAGAKQAKWQAEVANAMENFKVAGIDASQDEMIRKLDEKAALAQAKLDLSMDKVAGLKIDQDARAIENDALLSQFEAQMGLVQPSAPTTTEKELGRTKTLSS